MTAKFSALRAGHALLPTHRRILILISVKNWISAKVIMRLERFGKFKKFQLPHWKSNDDHPAVRKVPQTTVL
jgi:hypothetical protein